MLCARGEVALSAAAAEIGARTSSLTQPTRLALQVTAGSDRVDLIVHACRRARRTYARKQSFAQWRTTMAANLDSCFVLTQAALPLMAPGSRFHAHSS